MFPCLSQNLKIIGQFESGLGKIEELESFEFGICRTTFPTRNISKFLTVRWIFRNIFWDFHLFNIESVHMMIKTRFEFAIRIIRGTRTVWACRTSCWEKWREDVGFNLNVKVLHCHKCHCKLWNLVMQCNLWALATYLETEDIIAEKNIYKNRKVKKWILTKTARFQFHYNTSHPWSFWNKNHKVQDCQTYRTLCLWERFSLLFDVIIIGHFRVKSVL